MTWNDLPVGTDAVFLPGKIHGCDWRACVIYVNESANNGNGSFEIEIIDAERILKLYAHVDGNAEDFFDELPDWFHGEWQYCDNGDAGFDDLVEEFYDADFVVGRDGGRDEELQFLVSWARRAILLLEGRGVS